MYFSPHRNPSFFKVQIVYVEISDMASASTKESQWTERKRLVQARNRTKRTLIDKAYKYSKKCKADVYLYICFDENKHFTAGFLSDDSTNTFFQLLDDKLVC